MNKFGLDDDYFRKEFKMLNDKVEFMKPVEMMRYMNALFNVAETQKERQEAIHREFKKQQEKAK